MFLVVAEPVWFNTIHGVHTERCSQRSFHWSTLKTSLEVDLPPLPPPPYFVVSPRFLQSAHLKRSSLFGLLAGENQRQGALPPKGGLSPPSFQIMPGNFFHCSKTEILFDREMQIFKGKALFFSLLIHLVSFHSSSVLLSLIGFSFHCLMSC